MQLILPTKRVTKSELRYMEYTQRISYNDGKGITDQGYITEKLMNKLQILCGAAPE